MEALVEEKEGYHLRKIDIGKWGSPVAEQYRIESLPTLWLYEGRKRVETDTDKVLDRLAGS